MSNSIIPKKEKGLEIIFVITLLCTANLNLLHKKIKESIVKRKKNLH